MLRWHKGVWETALQYVHVKSGLQGGGSVGLGAVLLDSRAAALTKPQSALLHEGICLGWALMHWELVIRVKGKYTLKTTLITCFAYYSVLTCLISNSRILTLKLILSVKCIICEIIIYVNIWSINHYLICSSGHISF